MSGADPHRGSTCCTSTLRGYELAADSDPSPCTVIDRTTGMVFGSDTTRAFTCHMSRECVACAWRMWISHERRSAQRIGAVRAWPIQWNCSPQSHVRIVDCVHGKVALWRTRVVRWRGGASLGKWPPRARRPRAGELHVIAKLERQPCITTLANRPNNVPIARM